MNTIVERSNSLQGEGWDGKIDLPGLLMRLDANQIALWRSRPGIALYPTTRISPAMQDAIGRYVAELFWVADWWGVKTCLREAPMVFQ